MVGTIAAPGPLRAVLYSITERRTSAAGKCHHEAAPDERQTGRLSGGLLAEDKGAYPFRRVAKETLRQNLDAKMEKNYGWEART